MIVAYGCRFLEFAGCCLLYLVVGDLAVLLAFIGWCYYYWCVDWLVCYCMVICLSWLFICLLFGFGLFVYVVFVDLLVLFVRLIGA